MEDSVMNIQTDIKRWRVFSSRLIDVRPKEDGRVVILEVQGVSNSKIFTRGV